MDLLFLVCWTGAFLLGGFGVWRRFISRSRIYVLMLLNLLFLAGLFFFYPMAAGIPGIF